MPELPEKGKVGDRRKTGGSAKPGANPEVSFLEELQAAVEMEEHMEDVDMTTLVREVDDAGREILRKPGEDTLKRYRKAVRTFLMAAVKRAFRVKVVEGRGANPKLYVYVERVEAKLEDIAKQVLAAHVNPLKLLAQIEELRGLLLDVRT